MHLSNFLRSKQNYIFVCSSFLKGVIFLEYQMFKKDKIRLYAFLTVCLFVCFLLANFGVFASENNDFFDKFGITENDILNQEDFEASPEYIQGLVPYISKSSTNYTNFTLLMNNGLDFSIFENDSVGSNFSDFTNFCAFSTSNAFSFRLVPSGSFLTYENGSFVICMPVGNTPLTDNWVVFPSLNYYFTNNQTQVGSNSWSLSDYNRVIDNTTYYAYSTGSGWGSVSAVLSNMPIYYTDGSAITSLNAAVDINYSSLNGGGCGGDTESSDNNLVMSDGDFTFKNSAFTAPYNVSFNTGSIYPNGTISYTFVPNEYQIEHSSDFRVRLSFSFDYDVNYKNTNQSFSVFEQTSDLLNNQKNYHARWYYNSGDLNYLYVDLDDFISNGNNVSYTFESILSLCQNRGNGYESVVTSSKELDYVEYNKFNLNCTADLVADGSASGAITEWYNPMNKKGYTLDASGRTNSNPYEGSNNNDVVPSGSGAGGTAGVNGNNSNNVGGGSYNGGSFDGSSSSNYNGQIVINNNPTNNVTANGGNGSGGGGGGTETSESAITFYNTFNPFKLIINKMTDGASTVGEDTAEELGGNAFISIMSDIFSFIPIEMWTTLAWFLGASLTILFIAVVLRVVLDLL